MNRDLPPIEVHLEADTTAAAEALKRADELARGHKGLPHTAALLGRVSPALSTIALERDRQRQRLERLGMPAEDIDALISACVERALEDGRPASVLIDAAIGQYTREQFVPGLAAAVAEFGTLLERAVAPIIGHLTAIVTTLGDILGGIGFTRLMSDAEAARRAGCTEADVRYIDHVAVGGPVVVTWNRRRLPIDLDVEVRTR